MGGHLSFYVSDAIWVGYYGAYYGMSTPPHHNTQSSQFLIDMDSRDFAVPRRVVDDHAWLLMVPIYHNREVSYHAALNLTVSRRQNALYEKKGFDVQKWESLIEEVNALRKEIKGVADEYDVEWDEQKDEGGKVVNEALKKERRKERMGRAMMMTRVMMMRRRKSRVRRRAVGRRVIPSLFEDALLLAGERTPT
jgi:hypothetical protein